MMYLSVSDLTKNLLFLTWFLLKVCDVSSFAVESADYTASTESVDNSESSEETAASFTVKDHKAQAQSVGVFSPQAAGKYGKSSCVLSLTIPFYVLIFLSLHQISFEYLYEK